MIEYGANVLRTVRKVHVSRIYAIDSFCFYLHRPSGKLGLRHVNRNEPSLIPVTLVRLDEGAGESSFFTLMLDCVECVED